MKDVRMAGYGIGIFTAGMFLGTFFISTPCASADTQTDVVYVGGTGTGLVPHNPVPSPGFIEPLVPGKVDNAVSVLYPGGPTNDPREGILPVFDAIAAQDDPVTLICLSKGAQVCHGVEPGAPTGTTINYLGDPDGPNGISRHFGLTSELVPPTHDVTEISAEYDGVSDFPDRPLAGFGLSGLNALVGGFTPFGPHQHYGDGTEDDPLTRLDEAEVTVIKNPNGTTTTRKLIPTHALPITKMLGDTELTLTKRRVLTDELDKVLRPMIDAGYARHDETSQPANGGGETKSEPKSDKGTDNEA